jgi:hypothetical protein
MLDEITEMREPPCLAPQLLATATLLEAEQPPADWLRSWNDREGFWTNLRNIDHWLARAREV